VLVACKEYKKMALTLLLENNCFKPKPVIIIIIIIIIINMIECVCLNALEDIQGNMGEI
jgi:hypothetical protein